jgi:hypothetical protein
MNIQPSNNGGGGSGNDSRGDCGCGNVAKKPSESHPKSYSSGSDDDPSDGEESLEDEAPLNPHLLPPEMKLTEDELRWAWEIKVYVEAHGREIDPLCDMEYALHAVFARGNLREAVQRIQGLQRFRRLYRVQDTIQEGVQVMQDFIQLQPRVLMTVDVCGDNGEAIMAWNQGACLPARAMETEAQWKNHLLLHYYLFKIQQPTLQAVRAGSFHLIEGKDMTWENFDQTFEKRLHDEFWSYYPIKIKQLMVYNTNSVVNVAWGLTKRMMRPDLRKALVLGCQIEWNSDPTNPKLSLCDLYFQPNFDEATRQLMERGKQLLTQRCYNEKIFRL